MFSDTQIQPRIRVLQQSERYAKISVEPLEKGYGNTLGGSLRRVLLSSIEGVAITAIQVQGVQHEFSTIPGVREDMMEIVLNLKSIPLKVMDSNVEWPAKAQLDQQGEGTITAADIRLPMGISVVAPEKPVCTLTTDEVRFDAILTVEPGKGYLPASMQERASTIGTIPVDAIFSPVTRVNYFVEPTRVGQQTELDRLVLEISTNGALAPAAALAQAASILTQYMQLFTQMEGIAELSLREGFAAPSGRGPDVRIDDLDFSNRTYNCLKREGVETLTQLATYTEADMMKFKGFGAKSLDEVVAKLREHNKELRKSTVSEEVEEAF